MQLELEFRTNYIYFFKSRQNSKIRRKVLTFSESIIVTFDSVVAVLELLVHWEVEKSKVDVAAHESGSQTVSSHLEPQILYELFNTHQSRNAHACWLTISHAQEIGFTCHTGTWEGTHTHSDSLMLNYSEHSVVMKQDGELTIIPLHSLNDKR